jgi:hypothetical protein
MWREMYKARRVSVLEAYGGKCACCEEPTMEFLGIDHTSGNGAEERSALGGTTGVYRKLFAALPALSPGYRVLCHNCNCARGYYGYCPHERA